MKSEKNLIGFEIGLLGLWWRWLDLSELYWVISAFFVLTQLNRKTFAQAQIGLQSRYKLHTRTTTSTWSMASRQEKTPSKLLVRVVDGEMVSIYLVNKTFLGTNYKCTMQHV